MLWFPEYRCGCVMMCNRECTTFDPSLSILTAYVKENTSLKRDDAVRERFVRLNAGTFGKQYKRMAGHACPGDTAFKADWEKYVGTYSILLNGLRLNLIGRFGMALGLGPLKVDVVREGQTLRVKGALGEGGLREYKPRLFFTEDNAVLDFRKGVPIFKNIRLKKIS
jgi:hypothetical protein